MKINTNGTIGEAVALYTNKVVLELDVVQDPVVADATAIKATLPLDEVLYFLVRGVPLHLIRAADLEEVEFTEWPPSAKL